MSTSGRIHGEFLRLLYILAHQRTLKYFAAMGKDEPGTDAFTWRRSQYFWKHKAAIGLGNAVTVARSNVGVIQRRSDALVPTPPRGKKKIRKRPAYLLFTLVNPYQLCSLRSDTFYPCKYAPGVSVYSSVASMAVYE